MARTAFVYHPDFLLHDTAAGHPERSERLEAIIGQLQAGPLWDRLLHIQPRIAHRPALLRVHAESHIDRIAGLAAIDRPVQITPDTNGSPGTYRAALLAAGAPLAAIDAVLAARAKNAFCCSRPPGHHAEFDQVMGFCFFNNIAVAARYLQSECGIARVAIIDWDVHHGNGTQHSFESDDTVLFFSIHQFPHYPGTGAKSERGFDAGQGYTINIPVSAGATDADFIRHFEESLTPALNDFRPDFILLSAGFDAHCDDPLGQLLLSEEGFGALTRFLLAQADAHCQGRLVSLLEGGYDLAATAASVERHLEELLGA